MKRLGIRLWVVMLSLVLFILSLLWVFQVIFLEKFYLDARINEIKSDIADITNNFEYDQIAHSYDQLDSVAYSNNIQIEIVDGSNNVLFRTETSQKASVPQMFRNISRVNALEEALNGNEAIYSLQHPRFGTKILLLGIPISALNDKVFAMLISMPVAPVEETVAILKTQLVYISIILLIAAALISFFISRSLTKPIIEIKELAEKISKGDYKSKLSINRGDEIGVLAETVNKMSIELSKIDNLRKELIANVSHELRTPLSLIQGYAETVKDVTGDNPEKREKSLEIIIEEAKRLGVIVEDILNLSLLESENFMLDYTSFDIGELLNGIINKYSILKEQMKIELNLLVEDDVRVFGDEKRIEQVIINLVNNAFNHTSEGGKITLISSMEDGVVKISVSDTGIGIPKEKIKEIWDRFYKGEQKTGQLPATGLGLAIVKSILDAHDSSYEVESTEGEGTTFWFSLKVDEGS